jgi:hypothetical protein
MQGLWASLAIHAFLIARGNEDDRDATASRGD